MQKSTVRRGSLKVIVAVAAAAMAVAGLQVAFGSEAAHALTVPSCNGSYSNTTIIGNVEVKPGATCSLTNVTVTGSVQVDGGGTLNVDGGTINGNVTALPGSTIRLNEASENQCTDNPTVDPNTCGEPVVTVKGSVNLNGARLDSPNCPNLVIGGGLTLNNVDPFTSYGCITVGGNTSITNNTAFPGIAHSNFTGNVTISNNSGLQFGGPDPSLGNTVGGSLTVNNNNSIRVEYNTIRGNLFCSGNTSSLIANNTARGLNQQSSPSCNT